MSTSTSTRTVPANTWRNIAAKADRLARAGAVRQLTGTDAYAVEGDHGTYLVAADGSCSCDGYRWRGTCSHARAARLARAIADPYADGDPFAGLD